MRYRRSTPFLLLLLAACPILACAPVESDDETDDVGDGDDQADDGPDDDGPGEDGFRLVDLVDTEDGAQRLGVDTVNGIRCTDATHCVFGTRNFGEGGALYVTSDGRTLEPVLTSDDLPGSSQFLAIDDTGNGWIARIDRSGPLVIASDEPTVAANWTQVEVGTNESDSGFTVLNNQELVRAGSGGDWLYVYSGVVWHAASAPGPATAWSGRWSPHRVPPFPADYQARKEADPTLCDSDPSVGIEPDMTAFGFASPDLATVIYPAASVNQLATDPPGVCVSHDGGTTFHQVPFAGMSAGEIGPLAVHCLDANRCWAFGGVQFDSAPAYVYASINASAALPTWTRAAVPSEDDDDSPRAISFAPDGLHGWLVGDDGLAWSTADGGATWNDQRGALTAVAGTLDWTSVFAVDGERVWIGGADGALVTGP
jgi:hypothetical protein